ncbi:MAG: hypothetical protein LR005_01645 [Candidatus Pacebacteria bacterium]|nr:hypothetical protein [Candidatus Paceibacterota bacterium]
MKALVIAIILGGLGYYMFVFDSSSLEKKQKNVQNTQKIEGQKILEEMGVENKSYDGAITETYNTYKKGINDAKSAVRDIENRIQLNH